MNVTLLQQVKKVVLAEPRRLDMDVWMDNRIHGAMKNPRCGTIGCIAGWATVLAVPSKESYSKRADAASRQEEETKEDTQLCGQKALGLTNSQADRLFYVEDWPTELQEAYDAATTAAARAKVTAARIDLFVESEGRR